MDEATRAAHEKERTSVEAWTCENCGLVVGSLTRAMPDDKQGRCDKCHALFLAGVEHGRMTKPSLFQVRKRVAELDAKLAKLLAAIGMDGPWPLTSVLEQLADAADILLQELNYDGHGWEGIKYAADSARRIRAKLGGGGEGGGR